MEEKIHFILYVQATVKSSSREIRARTQAVIIKKKTKKKTKTKKSKQKTNQLTDSLRQLSYTAQEYLPRG